MNTNSSLNTSPQKLWQSLTEESETVHVPVLERPPAFLNPEDPVSQSKEETLSQENVDNAVQDILLHQQDQQQQQQQKNLTEKNMPVLWAAKILLPR